MQLAYDGNRIHELGNYRESNELTHIGQAFAAGWTTPASYEAGERPRARTRRNSTHVQLGATKTST
jgi:hypothetical protein